MNGKTFSFIVIKVNGIPIINKNINTDKNNGRLINYTSQITKLTRSYVVRQSSLDLTI